MKICELCGKESKAKKAILKVLDCSGKCASWEYEKLEMCDECITIENATLEVDKKKSKSKAA